LSYTRAPVWIVSLFLPPNQAKRDAVDRTAGKGRFTLRIDGA